MTATLPGTTQVWLPFVVGNVPVRLPDLTQAFMEAWQTLPEQMRPVMRPDPRLMAAARWKAEDMAAHPSMFHIASNGEWPNETLRRFGYALPDWYPIQGNQVESMALNSQTIARAFEILRKSPDHWRHVAATDKFFLWHIKVGCCWLEQWETRTPGQWGSVGVLLSAPVEEAAG